MTQTSAPPTLCGSLSLHPVATGARIHTAGYAALGLSFQYQPFRVTNVAGAITGMRALGIRGFGVSMPFKLEVMPLLDAIDDLAAQIGAVNTIVNDDGKLTGYNTDAHGALTALEEVVGTVQGKRVAVLGAGGAARAVCFALRRAGATLHVANRSAHKADELRKRLEVREGPAVTSGALGDLLDLEPYDALVNASSAGMAEYGGESPVSPSLLRADLVVMDIVYKPMNTQLLQAAREVGARTVDGSRMLLYQACRQFELYTGHAAPLDAMNQALMANLAP